ncbi:M48 family metallopeptidase [Psychroflexus salis]|nr:M48 family metallopeptidase [Psychroflexus salis]
MFKTSQAKIILSVFVFIFVSNCATNPFTGNKTMAIVPNNQILPMSFQQYEQVKEQSTIITETPRAEMIKRIGNEIAQAAEQWLDANGYKNYTDNYKWEFVLIDENTVNAWAMPGGKVAFYTGILPVAANENGIATIMGHEVAHALANHGQQRMSASTLQQSLGVVGGAIFSEDQQQQEYFNLAYGLGSQYLGMLPFSRKHETEADEIGLKLMAIAGYDPDEGSELWKRMDQASGGNKPPEFLSTHPSTENRIENLNRMSSLAKEEAKKFGVTKFKPNTPISD